METVPVYVGLDYHSRSVQVCVVDGSGRVLTNRRCGNDLLDIVGALPAGCVVDRAAVESCCGASDLTDHLRGEAGWPLELAHPGYVSRMKHNPDKSDYSDARMLAELSRAGFVPRVWLAPRSVRELRLLVRLRADLVSRIRAIKTRILGALRAQRVREPLRPGRWTRGWLQWLRSTDLLSGAARFMIDVHLTEWAMLRDAVKRTEAELAARTAEDPMVTRLLETPGVGPVTAWTMRALIGDVTRFGCGKQLARFCAVTPRNASSGERQADSGLIRAGDPLLKSVLIEAAHRLRRHDPRWSAFAAALEARGKPVSVVVAAIANRWTRWLYHQLLKGPTAAAA